MRAKRQVIEAFAAGIERAAPQVRERFDASWPPIPTSRLRPLPAAGEAHGPDWRAWPEPLRGGSLPADSIDPTVCRYHEVAQWLIHDQLHGLGATSPATGGRSTRPPAGLHPHGFDVWRGVASSPTAWRSEPRPMRSSRPARTGGSPRCGPTPARPTAGATWRLPRPPDARSPRSSASTTSWGCTGCSGSPTAGHRSTAPTCTTRRTSSRRSCRWLRTDGCRHRRRGPGHRPTRGACPARAAPHPRMYIGEFETTDEAASRCGGPPGLGGGAVDPRPADVRGWWQGHDIADRRDLGLLDEQAVRDAAADRDRGRRAMLRLTDVPADEPPPEALPRPSSTPRWPSSAAAPPSWSSSTSRTCGWRPSRRTFPARAPSGPTGGGGRATGHRLDEVPVPPRPSAD